MAQFVRATEGTADAGAASLTLWSREGAPFGRSSAPAQLSAATFTLAEPIEDGGTPAHEAVREAAILADAARTYVSVQDPEGLWMPEWGELR